MAVSVGYKAVPQLMFFDKDSVIGLMDAKTRHAMARFGAFVVAHARSLMLGHRVRKEFGAATKISNRQGISAPGKPPFPHEGSLVRLIYFSYDPGANSVVIGPIIFSAKGLPGADVLEHGGTKMGRDQVTGRLRLMHYQERPFMQPAFEAELKNAPEGWRE